MISLNDYLYSGNTLLKILHQYEGDLRAYAVREHSEIDTIHANFLMLLIGLLEQNEFLTDQSQRLREFYKEVIREYPYLAITFRGRIKSLIRAEAKFNAYVTEYIAEYYEKNGAVPPMSELKKKLSHFRDLIAYRIVISLPPCHLKPGDDPKKIELDHLYKIADMLPEFLMARGFTPEQVNPEPDPASPLDPKAAPFYKDYVSEPTAAGYQSLHITLFDNIGNCYTELQIRTKQMDDFATIGPANHSIYEKRQTENSSPRDIVPEGISSIFDEAWERKRLLQELDFSKIDVNMFTAYSKELINDGCGLYKSRMITPFEHLSRFQNDLID